MITAGATFENRDGGTMPDGLAPDGQPYPERLRTTRYDAGGFYRRRAGASGLVNLRGSYSLQGHRHTFGAVVERDAHETWFGEGTYTVSRGTQTWVVGAALLSESYDAEDVEGFDYSFTTPGLLSQVTLDAGARLSMTASLRADWHSEYGAVRESAAVGVVPVRRSVDPARVRRERILRSDAVHRGDRGRRAACHAAAERHCRRASVRGRRWTWADR